LGWVLESASSEALDGAGVTGDSIGVDITQLLAAAGTTRGATRFITGTPSTEVGARAEFTTVSAPRPGLSTRAAGLTIVPAQGPGHSTEIPGLLEATLPPAVRAACARAPSADSAGADRQEAFRRAEGPVSVAEVDFMVAEEGAAVGAGKRSIVISRA
jgi:hypothetical protein